MIKTRSFRMKLCLRLFLIFALFAVLLCYIYVIRGRSCDGAECRVSEVHLGTAVCGDRFNESLVMLKSALTFGEAPIHAHIFTDDKLRPLLEHSLLKWTKFVWWRNFNFTLYPMAFPEGKEKIWKKLFQLCASQRLFLPKLLPLVDSLLYVDTDILFMTPPERLWYQFTNFTDKHIAGLAPETEVKEKNWYIQSARHPFYEPFGLNSGIMLMNLTRMRQFKWSKLQWPLYQKYKGKIPWGDQDIINIIFHNHPERLYYLGCEWNYHTHHCALTQVCAQHIGAYIVHGNRFDFHRNKQPIYKAGYDVFTLRMSLFGVVAVLVVVFSVFGLTGHVCVLTTLVRKCQWKHKSGLLLILSLTVSDIIGCFSWGMGALVSGIRWYPDFLRSWLPIPISIGWSSLCFHIVVMSLNRFVAVCFPTYFSLIFTAKRTGRIVIFIWICLLMIMIPYVANCCFMYYDFDYFISTYDFNHTMIWYMRLHGTALGSFATLIPTVLYCCVAINLYLHKRANSESDIDISLCWQFFVILFCHLLASTAYQTIPLFFPRNHSLFFLIPITSAVDFSINPVVYLTWNKTIKEAFRQMRMKQNVVTVQPIQLNELQRNDGAAGNEQ